MPHALDTTRDGHVTTLTLDRPGRINALDAEMVEALLAALAMARADGTRLLVLRGAGKGFSAGFDFTALDSQSEGDLVLRFVRIEQLLQAVWNAPFMTLALAHGPCFGAAADLVASCRIRIAAADTTFRMPGLRFGIALGTSRLAQVVGSDQARSLLTTSRVFDAAEALEVGFLSAVAAKEDWPRIVAQTAADAAVLDPASLGRMLRLTRPEAGAADLAELVASVAEPGLKTRIRAYLDQMPKRKP